jgi:hypothetical protein
MKSWIKNTMHMVSKVAKSPASCAGWRFSEVNAAVINRGGARRVW